MICPRCKSENEMVFSAMSNSFLCQEELCGIEVEVEMVNIESLFEHEAELAVA